MMLASPELKVGLVSVDQPLMSVAASLRWSVGAPGPWSSY